MFVSVSATGEKRRHVKLEKPKIDMHPAGPEPVPFRVQMRVGLLVYAPETDRTFADDPVVGSGAEHFFRREIFQRGIGKCNEGLFILLRSGHREKRRLAVADPDVDHIVILALHHVRNGDLAGGFADFLRVFLPQRIHFRHHLHDCITVFEHFRRIDDRAFPLRFRNGGENDLSQQKAGQQPLSVEFTRELRNAGSGSKHQQCRIKNKDIRAAVVMHSGHMHAARSVFLPHHVEILLELNEDIFAENRHREVERALLQIDIRPGHRLVDRRDPAEIIRLND